MGMAADEASSSHIPALPSKSLTRTLILLFWQCALIPVQRLFSRKAAVEGWSCSTQIFVNYLRYSVENELHHARQADATIARWLNIGLKERLIDLETNEFHGCFIRNEPNADTSAILLYFHGGGYSLCSPKTYLSGLLDVRNAIEGSSTGNFTIFCLDYSLAPESKYPTQINEGLAAYQYLRREFSNHRLIVMGDSAGGNLTLALILKLKQSNLQQPDAAILISPWAKLIPELDQVDRDTEKDFVTCLQLVHHTHRYLSGPVTSSSILDPFMSPIFGDFSGTCPMLVHYGGYEWLLAQIEELIANLRRDGVDLTVIKEPYAPHICPLGAALFGNMAMNGVNAIAHYIAGKLQHWKNT